MLTSPRLVEQQGAPFDVRLASPREDSRRGSHVSFAHEQGYAVMQALIDRQIIGDFRAPNLMRFGITPLYLRFLDIWDAVAALVDILRTESWKQDRFLQRAAVT